MFNGKIHYFWPFSPFFLQNIDYLWAVHVNSHFSTHFSADAINMSSDWGVSINRGTPKSSSIFSIFSRMFHYNHPLWDTPHLWKPPCGCTQLMDQVLSGAGEAALHVASRTGLPKAELCGVQDLKPVEMGIWLVVWNIFVFFHVFG